MQKTIPQSNYLDKFTFLSKKIDVLYLKNDYIQIARIILSKKPKLQSRFMVKYTDTNLKTAVLMLISKLKTKSLRLLIGNEFAYVTNFKIPQHIQGSEERKYVFNLMDEIIPEELEDDDWDYKEMKMIDAEKEILAFAVVKQKYQYIKKVLEDINVYVEVVEPEEISITRNENPFLGISFKKDIKGKDNQNLNLIISKKKSKLSTPIFFAWIVVAISTVSLLFLLDMVFRGWLY